MNVIKKIFCLLFAIVLLVYISNVLILGEKFFGGLPWVFEFLFDIILILAPIFFIWVQITTSIKKYKRVPNGIMAKCLNCKASLSEIDLVSNMMISSGALSKEESNDISLINRKAMGRKEAFKIFLEKRIEKSKSAAKTNSILAAVSVSASGSGVLDSLLLLMWKIKTINSTIKFFGVRPSYKQLWTIYCHTIFGAFMVGSYEELLDVIDPEEYFNKLANPIVGAGISLIPQALFAAYSVNKVASMTREFLFNDASLQKLNEISKKAREEARENILPCRDDLVKILKEASGKVIENFIK